MWFPIISKEKGITLIELLLVLALISVLLSLALPAISRAEQAWYLKTDANKIAAVLRNTRQEAVFTGKSQSVLFYPESQCYRVHGKSYQYLNTGIKYVGQTTFINKISNAPACTFSAAGVPSSGGTVTLTNKYNKRLYIILNPVAGRVRVDENPPENWE
jgi:prepilin-type N-terminal cleavage/methylation domain-containing protein